jgi:hypothetical protein
MSCDICFAVSLAPCDHLFRLLPTELVTYLASADVNVIDVPRIPGVPWLPIMLPLATDAHLSVSLDLNVLVGDGEHFSVTLLDH